ncbi:MAG TPA: hypothetical protein VF678_09900 [bacterium]
MNEAPASRAAGSSPVALSFTILAVATALTVACTQQPTPYQPMGAQGGYQESRLQERVYRVTFQGNAVSRPGAVLDMALLRCAELTREAGYADFVLQARSTQTKLDTAVRSLPDDRMFPSRHNFLAMPQYETVTYVRYHEVNVLMRMLTAEEAKAEKDAYDAEDLLQRLAFYRQAKGAS